MCLMQAVAEVSWGLKQAQQAFRSLGCAVLGRTPQLFIFFRHEKNIQQCIALPAREKKRWMYPFAGFDLVHKRTARKQLRGMGLGLSFGHINLSIYILLLYY